MNDDQVAKLAMMVVVLISICLYFRDLYFDTLCIPFVGGLRRRTQFFPALFWPLLERVTGRAFLQG